MNVLPSDLPQRPLERVAVYFDYENVHRTAHGIYARYGEPLYETAVNPMQLAHRIVKKRNRPSKVEAVEVFRGRPVPEHQPTPASAYDKLKHEWHVAGCTVHSRDLKYEFPDDLSGQFTGREKGIDVALAVKMAHDAISGKYDAQILFSSDTDLLPILELGMELQSTHIELACWSKANRLYIDRKRKLPYCHYLSKDDFVECRSSAVLDRRD